MYSCTACGKLISKKCEAVNCCVCQIACHSHLSCLYVSTGDSCRQGKPIFFEFCELWDLLWWTVVCWCFYIDHSYTRNGFCSTAILLNQQINKKSCSLLVVMVWCSQQVYAWCIRNLIAFITHPKLGCRAALNLLRARSLITFASPISMSFPGYGANSSRLLLYLQSASPSVKLWMKPTWHGTELHKPPSVLSPGSQRLHYSVWGSFGCE